MSAYTTVSCLSAVAWLVSQHRQLSLNCWSLWTTERETGYY